MLNVIVQLWVVLNLPAWLNKNKSIWVYMSIETIWGYRRKQLLITSLNIQHKNIRSVPLTFRRDNNDCANKSSAHKGERLEMSLIVCHDTIIWVTTMCVREKCESEEKERRKTPAGREWMGRGNGRGGANREQVKMNTIWVHEREVGGGWSKTKAPALPACKPATPQHRHLPHYNPHHHHHHLSKSGGGGLLELAITHAAPPPLPPLSSLIPMWVQIIAKGATGHLQADSQLL